MTDYYKRTLADGTVEWRPEAPPSATVFPPTAQGGTLEKISFPVLDPQPDDLIHLGGFSDYMLAGADLQRIVVERAIIRRACEDILARGLSISVYDGEDVVIARASEVADIMREIMATEQEGLFVYGPDARRLGTIALVYGNDGYDVIADNSVALEHCLTGATALSEELRGRLEVKGALKGLQDLASDCGAQAPCGGCENLPPIETPVLALYQGEWRILERRTDTPGHEDHWKAYDYWDDPFNDGQDISDCGVTHWQHLPAKPVKG